MWDDAYANHRQAPPLGFAVGVVPLPGGSARLDVSQQLGLFISAKTAQPQACWAWVSFVSEQQDAVVGLPARRDIAASESWRQRVGPETAGAWQELLARESTTPMGWQWTPASFALCWLEQAFAEVVSGTPADRALARAQTSAAAYAECLAVSDGSDEAWRRCLRQVDPEAVMPEPPDVRGEQVRPPPPSDACP